MSSLCTICKAHDYTSSDDEDTAVEAMSEDQLYSRVEEVEDEVNSEEEPEGAAPEMTSYSSSGDQRGRRHVRYQTKGANHRIHHRSQKMTKVMFPNDKAAYIAKPYVTSWQCSDRTKLITLSSTSWKNEYNLVTKAMQDTIKSSIICVLIPGCFTSYKIIAIKKIINGCLWKKYRDFQRVVKDETRNTNEKMLFHGSNSKNINKLLKHGFDERFASMDGMFGAGIYFAKHSSKSNKYVFGLNSGCPKHDNDDCKLCLRQMLLCRVTLGKAHLVSMPKTFAHPPPGYHSVEAQKSVALEYPEYIVYRGEQVYPEYVISYKLA